MGYQLPEFNGNGDGIFLLSHAEAEQWDDASTLLDQRKVNRGPRFNCPVWKQDNGMIAARSERSKDIKPKGRQSTKHEAKTSDRKGRNLQLSYAEQVQ